MALDLTSFPVGLVLRNVDAIDNTTTGQTITFSWSDDTGPYLQTDNTPGNDTLVTELALTGYSGTTPTEGSREEFYLTSGALPSGKTRSDKLIEYTVTRRGVLNNTASTAPSASDSGSRNYKDFPSESFFVVNEAWLVKNLKSLFTTSVAASANKYVQFQLFGKTQDVTVGDGRAYFIVPEGYNNHNLTDIKAIVVTAGTTGTTDVQIYNETQTVDMLSTKLTIDSGETSSDTAATPPVIDTNNDDVATDDVIRVDIDAVSTTEPQGMLLLLKFTDPTL